MDTESIDIAFSEIEKHKCKSLIIVPDKALESGANISCYTVENGEQAKHHFHSISQMALFLFDDGDLEIEKSENSFVISYMGSTTTLTYGMAVYLDQEEKIKVFSNSLKSSRKLLQACHRYCTRWVRLDI